jgi:uncharacterized membrane protein
MATLIAIGYPDEATAAAAADEATRLVHDLIIQPDAIGVIVRDKDGSYHVQTSHHGVGTGVTWGMFWGFTCARGLRRSRASRPWQSTLPTVDLTGSRNCEAV